MMISPISTYIVKNKLLDVIDWDISTPLELAKRSLDYTDQKDIPIVRVTNHSLCSGGSIMFAFVGYFYRQSKKLRQ